MMSPGQLEALRLITPALTSKGLGGLWSALQRGYSSASSDTFTVEVVPYKSHRIDPPGNVVETNKQELMDMYTLMYKMRRMEVAADMMYKAKLIRGFCHLYDGQEAVATGIEFGATKNDSIITSYRDHCQHIARGGTVKEVMAELFGRVAGASRGLGGSMHMYRKQTNFYGGCGIVGAQTPLGAGLALKHKYANDGSIAFAMYGDGAANQGQLYEALNMAGLWSLPCIFVCENNHYGMGTAEWRAAKSPTFFTRGDYVPGLKVDGMDVLAVKHAVQFARAHVLEKGPIILEMDTYRYHGHSMSDPGSTYRTRDEISSMRQERDPVERVKKLLISQGVPAEELKKLEKELKREVDTAIEEAKSSPVPPESWLFKNIYVDNTNMVVRGIVPGEKHQVTYDPEFQSA